MKLQYIVKSLLAAAIMVGVSSCDDMLDTKSDSFVFDEDYTLSNANDSLYSAVGILNQLQALGERYVLLGELRGDLVSVPQSAPMSLQEISQFATTSSNDYTSRRDYYRVINNCNVAIARMDTTIAIKGSKVLLPEYVAIRTIRAWVYWQMALTYGSVAYVDMPVLNLEDSEKEYPTINIDALADMLISDLEKYSSIKVPSYGEIDGFQSSRFFIPASLLLGDLYLYQNQYEQAARMYYNVIDDYNLICSSGYINQWTTAVQEDVATGNILSYNNEAFSLIPYPSDSKKYHPNLVNMTYNVKPQLVPARWFVAAMNEKTHYHIDRIGVNLITGNLEGDLRGVFKYRSGNKELASSFGTFATGVSSSETMIAKFYNNASEYADVSNPDNDMFEEKASRIMRGIPVYRIPQIYLRYAEAVNRAGKPSLAFAMLKYGLRNEVVNDPTKVAPGEILSAEPWVYFNESRFDGNYGTAMRGRGLGIAVDNVDFIIPDYTRYVDDVDEDGNSIQVPTTDIDDLYAARQDSILWVENAIVDEMAAETAFEGNRFFDLLRVSRHRPDHPAFMAEKISARFDDAEAIRMQLMNESSWWLK